jgi:hypothetical protein
VGSIPIARSINPVDAVEFTGFPPPKIPIKTFGRTWTRIPAATGILDATIQEFFDLSVNRALRSNLPEKTIVESSPHETPLKNVLRLEVFARAV